ncbi:MAG: phosphoribosylglycinamide formyltransferase [Proteobacteria bacterium]|nr:phosphoribosylglycinamide formyltransferase [Pseudomonadota bacterium]
MKLAVFVSGSGTNLQALLDAQATGALAPGEIVVVVSNKPDAYALTRARTAGVATELVEHRGLERAAFEAKLVDLLERHRVEAIVLAGFMRVLTGAFTSRFPQRIINTHPSLLPAFPGVDAPAQAITYGVKVSGVTVHFVDATLDGGPIIEQVTVPVWPDDDAAKLHARILAEEHRLLPVVVQRLAAGRLSCQGRVVRAE